LNRIEIISRVLAAQDRDTTYLEIGVEKGNCFLQIAARRRFAVDPRLRVPAMRRMGAGVKDFFTGTTTNWFETTSDEFFTKHAVMLESHGLNAAFVDGLHTYQQSYKDVQTCLKYLKPGGAIMMHDCSPPNKAAAFPTESIERARDLQSENWKRDWCGDVWKSIVHLRSTEKDLRVFVLDCDFGVGVVTRGKPEAMLGYTLEKITEMTYEELDSNRISILNLKPPEYLNEFLSSLHKAKE
jgi:hypothetical protein